jgi:UDP-glucose 4-epimerase
MEVIGLDDFVYGAGNVPLLSDIRIMKGDLTNATFLSTLFAKHQFDIVFHLTDTPSSALSHHIPHHVYEANLVRINIYLSSNNDKYQNKSI